MIGPRFPVVLRAAAGGDEDAFGMLWYDLTHRGLRRLAERLGADSEAPARRVV
jgi:hypothetical protein